MFSSNRTVNPSPNRTSIKEANDHLQLLHQRVAELENTTREQAAELRRKEEQVRVTVAEVTEAKDVEIRHLAAAVECLNDRIEKLEHLLREKEQQTEALSQRCRLADEAAASVPALEKMLAVMKKLQAKSGKVRSKVRPAKRHSAHDGTNSVDGHAPNQSFVDMRIGRSFNINSNFSMSEDEERDSEML